MQKQKLNTKILAPPSNVVLTGPDSIKHNDEFVYECVAKGGNPSPRIIWTIKDQNGRKKEFEGKTLEVGVSQLVLKSTTEERRLDVSCSADNLLGRVSHTKVVHAHCKYFQHLMQVLLRYF